MEFASRIGLCVFRMQCRLKRCYSTHGLLNDISVLDLTRVVAGPFCTMTLGDLGANVIKVESFDGDEARKWGPPFIKDSADSYYFLSINRNKKSICVDLKSQHGKQVIYDLARKCDVLVENYLPGKLDKLEVGYEKLKKVNPKIIYCAITGFGPIGPYASKPGYPQEVERVAVITLRPTATKKEARKKVVWTEDTVDNEHMNKKKSKCCCIYEKPRRFDESDSDSSDEECEHCFGHVEKKHHHHKRQQRAAPQTLTINEAEETVTQEPTASLTLQPPEPAPAPPDEAPPAS